MAASQKAASKIAEGITAAELPADDTDVLKDRMKDALATLKTASSGKGNFLYDLPWYVLIGPPGSGKTTALVNSGLKFPLAKGTSPAAVAGVGGTRYCDWWFTEDAVLIDTAGRYTTQDSDAHLDKQSWLGFLDLLKKIGLASRSTASWWPSPRRPDDVVDSRDQSPGRRHSKPPAGTP